MLKLAAAISPPGRPGDNSAGMRDGDRAAVLVPTHAPTRRDFGKKLPVPANGIALGGIGSDVVVDQAQDSGSRLEIRSVESSTDGYFKWTAHGVGRVTINGEKCANRGLRSGATIRVVDTFFRFLCGPDLEEQYHETIYRLMICDFPTGLANARYLREALTRELSRASISGKSLAVASLQFESPINIATASSHDILEPVARVIRGQAASQDWIAARGDDLEIIIVAPRTSAASLKHQLQTWLQTTATSSLVNVGLAQSDSALLEQTDIIRIARESATIWHNVCSSS